MPEDVLDILYNLENFKNLLDSMKSEREKEYENRESGQVS